VCDGSGSRLGALAGVAIPLLLGVFVAWGLNGTAAVERLRHIVFDQYQRWQPRAWHADLPVRVIDIDDASLARLGQWPWPRSRLAELTNRLATSGAAAIGYDILFAEEDRLSPRALLRMLPEGPDRQALEKGLASRGALDADPLRDAFAAAPVIAALVLNHEQWPAGLRPKVNFVTLGDSPIGALAQFSGAVPPLPALREAARGLGVIQYLPDQDLVVRRVPMVFAGGRAGERQMFPGFAAENLRLALRSDTPIIKSTNASGEWGAGGRTAVVAMKVGNFEIPLESDGSLRVHFAGSQSGRTIPAWRVLDGSAPRNEIEGRIVLIGSSAASLIDLRSTPLETRVAGVDIHAEAIEHIAMGARLARPDWMPGAEALAILLLGVVIVLIARGFRPLLSAALAGAIIAGGAMASWLLFSRAELLVDPLIPGVSLLTAWLAATIGVYRRTEREKRFVRSAFSRYLAPALVERIADNPDQLTLGGETRDVSILFCDIRDFTTRSETLNAAGVVRFLNAVHTPFTARVLDNRGTIDKYIGDGLMAFWNAPLDVPGHANWACRAALAMAQAVPEIDRKLRAEAEAEKRPYMPLRIGVGVNTGEVFVGNLGSDLRFDYSIVGDPVNVAARIESATKEFAVPVLVSKDTRDAADEFLFVDLGATGLKGKTRDTSVFALHGPRANADPAFGEFTGLHDAAMAAVGRRDVDALERIALARAHPLSTPYGAFYDRLARSMNAAMPSP
jgi:adenylate cyclase